MAAPRLTSVGTHFQSASVCRLPCAFVAEDHALHFYFLGGPDFIVGPEAPAAERNVLGVIAKVGVDVGKEVIAMRRHLREIVAMAGGKPVLYSHQI